jgi:anti-sigma factor ChrR (cupin superfamily)
MVAEGWTKLRPGVDRKPLSKDTTRKIQFDMLRIKPNLTDKPHIHNDFEWVYVLEGSFNDQTGFHKKGDFIINTTEGIHQITTTDEGCLLLIVWTGSVREVQ